MRTRDLQKALPHCGVRRVGRNIEVTAKTNGGLLRYRVDSRSAHNASAKETAAFLQSKIPVLQIRPHP